MSAHRTVLILAAALLTAVVSTRATAGDRRSRAVLDFQHDLVSTLAQRSEAEPLFGAALLARTLPQRADSLGFHALIQRASESGGHRPAITWLQLSDCDSAAMNCPNPAALKTLQVEAPDNAAVWLLALGNAARNGNRKAAQDALVRASRADHYDDYTGSSLRALADAVEAMPAPAAIPDSGLSPQGARAVIVYALGSAQPRPAFQVAAQWCRKPELAVRTDCLQLGHVLESGSSPLARSLGLHLLETLSDNPRLQADVRARRLDLIWQVQQFSRLTERAHSDDTVARRLLELARTGKPEMTLMLDALHSFGIPLQPPPDWRPDHDAQPG